MGTKPAAVGGIVGSGFAANLHYDAIQRIYGTDVTLAGVYSPTRSNAEAFAEQRGLKAFDSLEALLDAVDVVHVCSSPWSHETVAIAALERGVHAIIEKPFTGYFGDGRDGFRIENLGMERARDEAIASISRLLEAESNSQAMILYAENWVYAPAIQKEREIIEKTKAQVLWMHGEEAHSGSHSPAYGFWSKNGGGALIGKAVHPLTAALYLKRVEGRARLGRPIVPLAVSCRTHRLTGVAGYEDRGFIRTDYHDVEDFAQVHIVFDDGTIADVYASEIVIGGIHNWLEVAANNHRTICRLNPNDAMSTYNPRESQFDDIYVVEKIGTKQGWAPTAPDEEFMHGFPQEVEASYRAVTSGQPPESDSTLAADTISVVYNAYLSAERGGQEVAVSSF
jgi:predicted dehydrogenase